MKKAVILLLAITVCFIGCGSTGGSSSSGSGDKLTSFADAIGKELKLVEVNIEDTFGKKIVYNRAELAKEKIEKTYTMTLTASGISGTAAPNTFSAPYRRGQGQAIEVLEIRSTKMAPIVQPEKLQEFAFFSYLKNTNEWSIKDGKLVLSSKTEEDVPVKMVFSL